MLSWIFTLTGLAISFIFTNLDSSSFIEALLCPIIFAVFLILALIKLKNSSHSEGYVVDSASSNTSHSSSMDSWSISSGDSSVGGE